ncbi:MAG: hypothetical protein Q7S27_04365 [Nanoarchaeota archaeon]|nr:hypothetical protein [Nanoarchaeota archaeon]
MLHKRGVIGVQLMIIPFLVIMAIIGVSIAISIWAFYGEGYDFREAEAEMLNSKISKCILENEISKDFFSSENFYTSCGIDSEVIKKNNMIKICDGFGEECLTSKESIFIEGSNFNVCGLNEKDESFPKCFTKEIQKEGKKYVIVTLSNQVSRRVQG